MGWESMGQDQCQRNEAAVGLLPLLPDPRVQVATAEPPAQPFKSLKGTLSCGQSQHLNLSCSGRTLADGLPPSQTPCHNPELQHIYAPLMSSCCAAQCVPCWTYQPQPPQPLPQHQTKLCALASTGNCAVLTPVSHTNRPQPLQATPKAAPQDQPGHCAVVSAGDRAVVGAPLVERRPHVQVVIDEPLHLRRLDGIGHKGVPKEVLGGGPGGGVLQGGEGGGGQAGSY